MNREHVLPQIVLRSWPFPRGAGRLIDRYFRSLKFSQDRATIRTTDGFEMTVQPNDLIGRHLYLTGEFDRSIVELLLSLARPGDTLLDIGANIGYVSACFLANVPDSSVVAVEPQPAVADLLRQNLARFGRSNIIQAAISDHDGAGAIEECADNPGAGRLVNGGVNSIPVDLWTGARLFTSAKIAKLDLVKIDVEGHEEEVFASCIAHFGRLKPRAIVFECTTDKASPTNSIGGGLRSIGYDIFGLRKRLTKLDLVPIRRAGDCSFNDYVAMLRR